MSLALSPHPQFSAPKGPVVCVVMDGVGIGAHDHGDAVHLAHTPTLDWLMGLRSSTRLCAHGRAVGMPSDADMGNSEVGHNALGAGRVFDQGAKLVSQAIASGSMFEGAVWKEAVAHVQASGQPLHLLGLLSDGNVHSHIDHLLAMLRQAAREGVRKARVHVLTDGRDVPGRSALGYVDQLEACLAQLSTDGRDYRIASGGGRMHITMDRYEADWAMVERGFRTHVHGEGRRFASARQAITTLYEEHPERDDQFLPTFVIADDDGPVGPILDGAAVLLFNFRGDRAIEISRAFEDDDLAAFDRGGRPDVLFAGMMQYDGDLQIPRRFLVDPPAIDRTMGELLAATGRRQLAIAETQKYGHVTYFWNGNRTGAFDPALEQYLEIASDVLPFEERPWMKAAEVTDALVHRLRQGGIDFARVNYANGDMVGHTGHLDATRVAVEAVDLCLTRLVSAVRRLEGVLVVTADHGNADQMFDRDKDGSEKIRTSHSLNPVPLVIFDPRLPEQAPPLRPMDPQAPFGLANVASTCIELLGLTAPPDYLPSLLLPSRLAPPA
ncbi:2,3-bisphosphoglycerate-independent phosphoglycerate mutase [Paraliomyxa miuraensis]|uniref:2,3-bisphosphoglycerate-independent phosphoglycerate mutase n=1 Tax=Paraliomyxa miuraensis TaxID=376150 RepID=UPI002253016C|nr:2,3-bisphosphoglycerate-independent phosphoglycerate mutase [Paraliomyxa miuraensis]MCX4243853.1 2,3-bisphosphoglycerate-independent phosphoglycerate mutase [Paraliomyxa miuraensis]